MIEIIKEIILDFQHEILNTGIKRHLAFEYIPGKAFVCIGVRRSGKSTFLFQIINSLIYEGVPKENILYINFFDDRLHELKNQKKLSLIMEAYFSLYTDKKDKEKIYCFFDELQEMDNWESFIDRILRTENCNVYITGSSAKLLSNEIATQMRGRSLTWELFPFSFNEYLDFENIEFKKHYSTHDRILIENAFANYFKKGGFPEVADVSDRIRIKIHQEYFKTILHRDIIERNDTNHPKAVIEIGHRLINNISSLYSINRLTSYLKSLEYKVSKNFVNSCVQWFQDTFFIFSVKIFDSSISRQNINPKKCYCIDHSFVKSVNNGILVNDGHLLENLVFVHLRQKFNNIFYYRTKNGNEIDFICYNNNKKKDLIQVCFSVKEEKTKKREVNSLFVAMNEQNIENGYIVTFNETEIIIKDDKKINIIPAWKWILELSE